MRHHSSRRHAAAIIAFATIAVTVAGTSAHAAGPSRAAASTVGTTEALVPSASHAAYTKGPDRGGVVTGTEISPSKIPSNTAAPGSHLSHAPLKPADISNPDAGLHSVQPPAVRLPAPTVRGGSAAPALSTAVGTQIQGMTQVTASGYPSDVSAASGTAGDVVETANESWAVYNKSTGAQLYTSTLQNWYGSLAASTNIFDPHVTFDPVGDRYIMVASDGTNFLVAVAEQSGALGGSWCGIKLSGITSAGQFADFPQVGVDANFIYLTMVDFDKPEGTSQVDSIITVLSRNGAEGCKPNTYYSTFTKVRDPGTACLLCGNDNLAFHVAPATAYENTSTEGWLADAYADGGSHITVFHIDTKPSLSAEQISTPSYSTPPSAAQPGTTTVLDTGVTQVVNITKNAGQLYLVVPTSYTWPGSSTANAAVTWMQVNAVTGSIKLNKSGTFGTAGYDYYYPSSAGGPSTNPYQVVNYSLSSSTVYPSTAVVTIDNTGTITSNTYTAVGSVSYVPPTTVPNLYRTSGCSATPCVRWGDFSSVLNDPSNRAVFWAAGETAMDASNYATQITPVTVS